MNFSKIKIIKVCLMLTAAVNEGQDSLEFLLWSGRRGAAALSQLKPGSAVMRGKLRLSLEDVSHELSIQRPCKEHTVRKRLCGVWHSTELFLAPRPSAFFGQYGAAALVCKTEPLWPSRTACQ